MDDQQLINGLLSSLESEDLDFKSRQYDISKAYPQAKFIKDIVAMANTPRSGSAYILLGVTEHNGKATGTRGVTDHPDPAELLNILSDRVDPVPRFTYRRVSYNDVELGLIEIPIDQPGIAIPRNDLGVLRKGAVYIRRNSANTEADSAELDRIYSLRSEEVGPTPENSGGAWQQMYRACDGFDPRRIYIAVFDRDPATDTRDWEALAGVRWNIIIDFDTGTDQYGNLKSAEAVFRARHALQITALDDVVRTTARSTIWVAASGLDSRPTTMPSLTWRDWNRSKSGQLEQVMDQLAKVTEPSPVTLVVFGGPPRQVSSTCEIADRVFTDRVEYVFACLNPEKFKETSAELDAQSLAISLPHVCQGLRDLQLVSGSPEETLLPKLGGGTIEVEPQRARWVEEQLEIVPWEVGPPNDSSLAVNSFLQGATPSWDDLNGDVDAEREIMSDLQHQVRRELETRATRRVNLWHWPGAGATTVSRRVAWNLRQVFPAVVALDIQPQDTAERIRHLFGVTRLPILVIIDVPGITREDVDRLYNALRNSHVHAVLVNVERRLNPTSRSGTFYLDAMLTTGEAVRLSRTLSVDVPNRRTELETLIDQPDRRKRIPFYFGLVAYGRDFRGLESYVDTRLSAVSRPVGDSVLLMAFAYYFGQVTLSLQTFTSVFNLEASSLINLTSVIPDHVGELLVEEDGGVRPAHYLIAEEILQQMLTRPGGDRRNWAIGLADLAIRFIDLMADLPHGAQGNVSDTLKAVLIERGSAESPAGPWETQFSRFLMMVPDRDGRQRVLEHLSESFPYEPHFWAHLGRFYSREVKNHSKAHEVHQKALDLQPDDSLLHHMTGMGWRAELYERLPAYGGEFTSEHEIRLFDLLEEASREFAAARTLNRLSEYNYISEVQMIEHFVGSTSVSKGFQHRTVQFLTLSGNDAYRELVDQAQNLLSDLALIKGDETPSQLQVSVEAGIEEIYGNHSEAIERLTNVLDRREAYRPPLRRAIIRAYVAKSKSDWSQFTERELARIVRLAEENVTEEPASDYNLRLWLQAIRVENSLSVDRVVERLAYKRLQDNSVDTTYYLYILKFLQLISGDLATRKEIPGLIDECTQLARDLSRTSSSFEWLGNGPGLAGIVNAPTLSPWDSATGFWSNTKELRPVTGRIAQIRNQGSGEIELPSGLRAFFTPARGEVRGGYIAGQDIGREVEFFLGFSYDGLRAWSVRDPAPRSGD